MLAPLVPSAAVVLGLTQLVGSPQSMWAQLGTLAAASFLTVLVAILSAQRVRSGALRLLLQLLRLKTAPRA